MTIIWYERMATFGTERQFTEGESSRSCQLQAERQVTGNLLSDMTKLAKGRQGRTAGIQIRAKRPSGVRSIQRLHHVPLRIAV